MKVSLIAAIGKNHELGKGGEIPWHISEDLKRFRRVTSGHPIIMGRKTFESIGHPLPNRTNIIITRDGLKFKNISGLSVALSLQEAFEIARKALGSEEIFVIGGGQIFKQSMGLANKLYLTIIDADFEADTFFPDYSDFKKTVFDENGESDGYKYKFLDLER